MHATIDRTGRITAAVAHGKKLALSAGDLSGLVAQYPFVVCAVVTAARDGWSVASLGTIAVALIAQIAIYGTSGSVASFRSVGELNETVSMYVGCVFTRLSRDDIGIPEAPAQVVGQGRARGKFRGGLMDDLFLPRLLVLRPDWLNVILIRPGDPAVSAPNRLMTFSSDIGGWILLNQRPKSMTIYQVFQVLHELGHCSMLNFAFSEPRRTIAPGILCSVVTIQLITLDLTWRSLGIGLVGVLAAWVVSAWLRGTPTERAESAIDTEIQADIWALRRIRPAAWGDTDSTLIARRLFLGGRRSGTAQQMRRANAFSTCLDALRAGREAPPFDGLSAEPTVRFRVLQWLSNGLLIAFAVGAAPGADRARHLLGATVAGAAMWSVILGIVTIAGTQLRDRIQERLAHYCGNVGNLHGEPRASVA